MEIKVTSHFSRNYKRLPRYIKIKTREREILFRQNPFDPRLKTHKLLGRDKEAWAFSIDYSYRIKFIFLSDEEVLFLDIGTHRIYK